MALKACDEAVDGADVVLQLVNVDAEQADESQQVSGEHVAVAVDVDYDYSSAATAAADISTEATGGCTGTSDLPTEASTPFAEATDVCIEGLMTATDTDVSAHDVDAHTTIEDANTEEGSAEIDVKYFFAESEAGASTDRTTRTPFNAVQTVPESTHVAGPNDTPLSVLGFDAPAYGLHPS